MAQTYKVLGQAAPSAVTLTTLYTVPSATEAVVSTISVCNRSSATDNFRIAVRPAGSSISNEHYVVYDALLYGNDTVFLSVGMTLNSGDVISCYAGSANVSFNVYGSEVA